MSQIDDLRLHPEDAGRIEFGAALHFLLHNWTAIAGAAVVGGIVAFGLSFAIPKKFEAEVIALPIKEQQGLGSLRSLMGGYGALASLAGLALPGADNPAEMAVVRLKSRGFIEGFIHDNDLLPELFPSKWDDAQGVWLDSRKPPTLFDGYRLVTNDVLRVAVDKRVGTVTVEVRWTDPVVAAKWANLLVERLNRVTRQQAVEDANRSITYLQREFDGAKSVELRQSIAILLEGQMNRRMMAVTQPDFSLKVVDLAKPSDFDHFVSPRRTLIAAISAVIAGFLGGLIAWVRGNRRRGKWAPG